MYGTTAGGHCEHLGSPLLLSMTRRVHPQLSSLPDHAPAITAAITAQCEHSIIQASRNCALIGNESFLAKSDLMVPSR
jgi:hypothetical protein